jgi:hypothetical protein
MRRRKRLDGHVSLSLSKEIKIYAKKIFGKDDARLNV